MADIVNELCKRINGDLEFILRQEGTVAKDRWAYDVDNTDLYHVHICLKPTKPGDFRINIDELFSEPITFLYHSKEGGGFQEKYSVPEQFKETKRNIFHHPNGTWEALDDINSKGILPLSRGFKDVTIYFAKTLENLNKHPVKSDTVIRVGNYFFGTSSVYPFLE